MSPSQREVEVPPYLWNRGFSYMLKQRGGFLPAGFISHMENFAVEIPVG